MSPPTWLFWPVVVAPSGGTPWKPDDLSSLVAWYKADSISQSDNTDVTTWADSSGNSYDLTGYGTTKPKFRTAVLNGLPVVRFNASGTLKRATWTGYPTNNSAITVAGVVKRNSINTNCSFVAAGPSSASRQDLLRVRNDNKYAVLRRDSGGTFRYADAGTAVGTGNLVLLAGQNASAQPFMRLNGDAQTLTFGGGYTDLTLTDLTPADLTLGGLSDGTPLNSNDEIAEVVVCDVDLSVSDREKLEGYLAHKWGLTANLPPGHPYKTSAPTTVSPLWTPSDLLTTPEYWLDASSLTGLSDGDQLDEWTNLGALPNPLRDAPNSEPGYPKYRTNQLNSKPGIEWPAESALYGTRMWHFAPYVSAAGNLPDITIVAVVRSTDTASGNQIVARSGHYELINGRASGKFSASFWNGSFNTTAGVTTIDTANSYLVSAQWDKSNQTRTLWVNGNQDAQSTGLGAFTYNTNMQAIIGSNAYNSPPGQTFSGFMFEIVVLHENIGAGSPSEREKLEGYMAHKWGLASSLPAGHPYKNAAPTV